MTRLFDRESMFGNGLWALHLKPQKDELLSSWIIRLAHAHGFKVQTFCHLVFGRDYPIWNRDINVMAPDHVKDVLLAVTGATEEQFKQTTLRAYEGELTEYISPNGNSRWILSLGIYHRKRKKHGLMFCPKCLAEDTHPYYRRLWRLAFATVCTRHGCSLLDACPNCNEPVEPHRTDMMGRGVFPNEHLIARCWNCEFDFRQEYLCETANKDLMLFQKELEMILQRGWCEWGDTKSLYSLLYFEGLHQLISGILKKESRKRLKKDSRFTTLGLNEWEDHMLENSSLSHRQRLFEYISWLFEDWPERFKCLTDKYHLRYSDFKGDYKELVSWYESIFMR